MRSGAGRGRAGTLVGPARDESVAGTSVLTERLRALGMHNLRPPAVTYAVQSESKRKATHLVRSIYENLSTDSYFGLIETPNVKTRVVETQTAECTKVIG